MEYQGWTGDSDDNDWVHIPNWDILPSAPVRRLCFVIPQIPSGRTIRIVYRAVHPTLSASTDTVSEYIHPALLIPAVTKEALRWYNGSVGGGKTTGYNARNEAATELEMALRKHPIWETEAFPKIYKLPRYAHAITNKAREGRYLLCLLDPDRNQTTTLPWDGRSRSERMLKLASDPIRDVMSDDANNIYIRNVGKKIGDFDEQRDWKGGMGNEYYNNDPSGWFDGTCWTLSKGHLLPR